ncbi:MAG: nickel-responsive transcriptional regulator NikR [Candidatus Hydrothermarchaeales archaeon]
MHKVVRFGVSLDRDLLEKFDALIEERGYANRSEAIRDLIRNSLVTREWEAGEGEVVGSLTLIYHHGSGVSDKLTDLQHQHAGSVVSGMHVHLDEENCAEILVLRGMAKKIKEISDSLISSRGVKHGKLVMTTTGKEVP